MKLQNRPQDWRKVSHLMFKHGGDSGFVHVDEPRLGRSIWTPRSRSGEWGKPNTVYMFKGKEYESFEAAAAMVTEGATE